MIGARKCSDRQAATYSSSDREGMQGQPGQPAKSLMSDLWEREDPKSLNLRCVSLSASSRDLEMRLRQIGWCPPCWGARPRPILYWPPICKPPNRLGKLSIMEKPLANSSTY